MDQNDEILASLCSQFVPATYIHQGMQALSKRHGLFRQLIEHRRLPEEGWDEATIEGVLHDLAMMDSNNFMDNVGVGEREARIYSPLVARRHHRLGHGMGRSGDIAEPQPKAAGSSLMVKMTNFLVLDALHVAGLGRMKECMVLPLATGMAMTLTLLSLPSIIDAAVKEGRAEEDQAERRDEGQRRKRYVLWPRIDQKSCLKAILTAGYLPLVIPMKLQGDELVTDIEAVKAEALEVGVENILCLVSTTSCFAPRAPDSVRELATLCQELGLPHLINNAYGVQCSKITHAINEACREGRVDVVIQSTDKNFLVPVGGSIVASPKKETVASICKTYPGRANSSPIQDVFITLLSMGRIGYQSLLKERKTSVEQLREGLSQVASKHGERLLHSPHNTISFAITLTALSASTPGTKEEHEEGNGAGNSGSLLPDNQKDISYFGSMLFMRCVSGTRVVPLGQSKSIGGSLTFQGYGSHTDHYPAGPYLTAACAIGVLSEEITEFLLRLDKAFVQYKQQKERSRRKSK